MLEFSRLTHQRYSTACIIIGSIIFGMILRKPLDYFYPLSAEKNNNQSLLTHADQAILSPAIEKFFTQGEELLKQHDYQNAALSFKSVLKSHPHIAESLIRLGTTAFHEELYESAATYFKTALYLDPSAPSTYMRLGLTLHKLKEYKKAENVFKMVIKHAPHYAEAYIQLARVLMDSNQLDDALVIGKKGIELAPTDIHAHLNLGHIYNKRGETKQAIACYENALSIDNKFPNALYNLGYTLRLEGKLTKSIPYLEEALTVQPNYPDAHIALAQAYWSLNDFNNAWKHYYYRWQIHGVDPEKLNAPLWDGSDLHGKTILLYAEQGMGDTLQFIRFAKEVKKRGARIICKVQDPIKKLISSYPYVDIFISKESIPENIDAQAALMSIPGIINTTPKTIPAEIPYLTVDKTLINTWKQRLAHDHNFKIGICWNVDPQHEISKSPLSLRSVPLNSFAQLADIPGVSFYSLQKTHDQKDFNAKPATFTVHTFNPDFDEVNGRFMDTAAVIENLDLIISVDTSIIHIAGALGKPVWVILPSSPDCRWYFDGDTTPWYPTMRLFRQTATKDYFTPMNLIKKELIEYMQKNKQT